MTFFLRFTHQILQTPNPLTSHKVWSFCRFFGGSPYNLCNVMFFLAKYRNPLFSWKFHEILTLKLHVLTGNWEIHFILRLMHCIFNIFRSGFPCCLQQWNPFVYLLEHFGALQGRQLLLKLHNLIIEPCFRDWD